MKKVLSIILAIVLMCGIFVPCGVIAEESVSSIWAKEYVDRAIKLNWVSPRDFTKEITRGQFCAVAEQFLYSAGLWVNFYSMDTPFTDIGEGYSGETGAIKYLYCLKIVNGKSEALFCPDDYITREEAAVIFARILDAFRRWEVADITTNEEEDFLYADYKEISSWATKAVYDVRDLGIMQGTGRYFEPKKQLTYEEAVAMLIRLYDKRWKSEMGSLKQRSFADKLNSLMPGDKNYMFSPLSIKMALSLAANGAEGETQNEITKAFGIASIEDENEKTKSMIEKYSKVDVLKFDIANSIWVNRDKTKASFNPEYEKCATEYYHARLGEVSGKDASDKINSWVSEKTREKINSIIPEGYSDFYAAIVNALYFKGAWQNEFSKSLTKPENFTNADGTVIATDFMTDTGYYNYCDDATVKIIEMPYKNSFSEIDEETGRVNRESYPELDVSMYIMLAEGDVDVAEKLSWATRNSMSSTFVKLSIPKFEIEFSTQLKPMLETMGIKNAFKGGFNGILENELLFIDNVIHKTYISIDEEGTEAAAVTAVMMGGSASKSPEPVEFKADKPFWFVIRDNENGEILFMGRYAYAE